MNDSSSQKLLDVVIVGAGWSGLYAAKYANEEGLSVKVLESRNNFGGVWNYSESAELITVMRDTVSSSSRHVTESSDFPMSEKAGNFMRHQDVMEYLHAYSQRFDLLKDIEFNVRVVSADKTAENEWQIVTSRQETFYAKHLVVCTGSHQSKRKIAGPVSSFSGQLHHAGDFKHFDDFDVSADDHVIVYGGGETASDIIDQLVKKPCQITWAIRDGQHFFRKTPLRPSQPAGTYDRWDNPLDTQSTSIHNIFTDFDKSKPGMRYACNLSSSGSVFSYQGHGLNVWKNDVPWYHDFFNKNGHAVDFVWSGRVKAASGIKECKGQSVTFADSTQTKATHIICCFGYVPNLTFLPEWANQTPLHLMYKLVFHPKDPSLSFIGYARPTILSIPFMAEMQCMWASQVWAGKNKLPSSTEMQKNAQLDLEEREAYFPKYSNKNIVQPLAYTQNILSLLGADLRNKTVRKNRRLMIFRPFIPFSPLLIHIMRGKYSNNEVRRLYDQAFPLVYLKKDDAEIEAMKGPLVYIMAFYYTWMSFLKIGMTRLFAIDNKLDAMAKRRMKKYGTAMRTYDSSHTAMKNRIERTVYRVEEWVGKFAASWFMFGQDFKLTEGQKKTQSEIENNLDGRSDIV